MPVHDNTYFILKDSSIVLTETIYKFFGWSILAILLILILIKVYRNV